MKKQQILCDMDGVLVDFLSGAIDALNKKFNRSVTLAEYADRFGRWETYDFYDISTQQFWDCISNVPDFWLQLQPTPYCFEFWDFLNSIGDVTIVTSPSLDPNCAKEKLEWLDYFLKVKPSQVFIGSRKYLMAGNGLLVDDYYDNVDKFRSAGGEAVLVPSVWNTNGLTFERMKNTVLNR